MFEKLKKRKNFLIADFISVIVFMVVAGIATHFIGAKYTSLIFFTSGILHGKLSASLEKALVKNLED